MKEGLSKKLVKRSSGKHWRKMRAMKSKTRCKGASMSLKIRIYRREGSIGKTGGRP